MLDKKNSSDANHHRDAQSSKSPLDQFMRQNPSATGLSSTSRSADLSSGRKSRKSQYMTEKKKRHNFVNTNDKNGGGGL